MLQLYIFIILPLLADTVFGTHLLITLSGACFWAILVIASLIKINTKDKKLRKIMLLFQVACISGLVVFLVNNLKFLSNDSQLQNGIGKNLWLDFSIIKSLSYAHALLLTSSGALAIFSISMFVCWQFKDKNLRDSNMVLWAKKLPALESLQNSAQKSLFFVYFTWTLGMVMAFVVAMTRWAYVQINNQRSFAWISDWRVLATIAAWLILTFAFRFKNNNYSINKKNQLQVLCLVLFLALFFITLGGQWASKHMPTELF